MTVHSSDGHDCKLCAELLAYTPKYTASQAAGTPLPIKVKTLGKLSYKMHVQPVLGAKLLYVIFVQVRSLRCPSNGLWHRQNFTVSCQGNEVVCREESRLRATPLPV